MDNFNGLNARISYEMEEESISDVYHENSKMRRVDGQFWGKRFAEIRSNINLCRAMSKAYKEYPNCEEILLCKSWTPTELSFEDIVINRRSTRLFSGESITLEQLSKLLYFTYGITFSFKAFGQHGGFFHSPDYTVGSEAINTLNEYDGYQSFRAAASGGALYPLEIYLCVDEVDDLEKGLYHYNVRKHSLEKLRAGDLKKEYSNLIFNEDWQSDASVHFIFTSIMDRTRFKYLERGYRFINIDLGHAVENLYLTATACNLGCVAIGGFFDNEVNDFLGIDGQNETTMLLANVGRHKDIDASPLVKCNIKKRD